VSGSPTALAAFGALVAAALTEPLGAEPVSDTRLLERLYAAGFELNVLSVDADGEVVVRT